MKLAVAVDIGGTFTDVVVADPKAHYRCLKVATTRPDLSIGVIEGLTRAVDDWSRIGSFVHGTTYGLNTLIQRAGARVGLVATAGFGDVYVIGRTNRPEMYNLHYRKPEPLVRRRDTVELAERMRCDGSASRAPGAAELEDVCNRLRELGVESIAVSFLHSYACPDHEVCLRDALQRAMPEIAVSLSHEVAREWREYERTSTVVTNAYIAPAVRTYLDALERELRTGGMTGPLHVMQSSGGVMSFAAARDRAVSTLLSGPVGGAVGTVEIARDAGLDNVIGVDMGGTTFDACLVTCGRVETSTETEIEGLPLLMPVVDIFSIGAGGGSIAWQEPGGGLRVGPQSAGSQPGPACYGRGGTAPTVTDANVLLGRVGKMSGGLELDRDAANHAVSGLAGVLGMDPLNLAEGITDVVNANMAGAIRQITVARGIDPRDFTLVAFGGGGPVHAAFLAEELEIDRVVVPEFPATFSAWGMLQCDARIDVSRTWYRSVLDPGADQELAGLFAELEAEATDQMETEGIRARRVEFVLAADMRYVGQEYTVTVSPRSTGVEAMTREFHESHAVRYGHANVDEEVEFVTVRVTAIGQVRDKIRQVDRRVRKTSVEPADVRPVRWYGEWRETPVYRRDQLSPGWTASGPLLVEEDGSTTVVSPRFDLAVDERSALVLDRKGENR